MMGVNPRYMKIMILYFLQDFLAIGIDKKGFRLRLQKAAKRLPSLRIYKDDPVG